MQPRAPLLFLTVLVIATAGLVYELLAGAVATSVLGNSLRQYSTTIGVYLFAMGAGSYLSRYVEDGLAERFVQVEYSIALVGGLQALLLFMSYGRAQLFPVLLYVTLLVIGALVGIEIPLLMRILRDDLDFKELVAKVLAFDYLGALLGSLVFSIVLVEILMLPLERIGLCFGLLNCVVGLMSVRVLRDNLHPRVRRRLLWRGAGVFAVLTAAFVYADRLHIGGEQRFYPDRIVHAAQTGYQRIVVTASPERIQLYLDGNLQFSSIDEYRYHEALVHPAMARAPRHARVLVLGGGDGLAVRELVRYPDVSEIVLVELDAGMTSLAQTLPALVKLNGGALSDPRVHIVHDDAMVWLDETGAEGKDDVGPARKDFDVAIVDFPDPNNFSLGKLYTARFYDLLAGALRPTGVAVVQSTSPLFARRSFWCIERSMRAAGLHTAPFHVAVPSFGEWGFVMAMRQPFEPPTTLAVDGLRYLSPAVLPGLFAFPADMAQVETDVNRLNQQVLVQYYEAEWAAVH